MKNEISEIDRGIRRRVHFSAVIMLALIAAVFFLIIQPEHTQRVQLVPQRVQPHVKLRCVRAVQPVDAVGAHDAPLVLALRADLLLVAAFFIVLGVLAAAGPAAAYLWLVAATGNGNHAYFLGLAHCLAASVLATKALAWHVPRRRALAA